MENLSREPLKQEAWYLQIREDIHRSKRPIDKMPVAKVLKMYRERKFPCDTCGKELGKMDLSLEDHIAHLINPSILWSCEDCLISDMKHGRIIGATEPF